MSYSKTNWQNLPNTTTPINATRLNKMENGIADANGAIGVDTYDSTLTYAVNDLCIYNNTLYICTTAITTAEAFNSAHWKAISIQDMLIAKTESSNVVTELNKTIDVSNISGIVDNGSNTNGYYIKFYDGTLIQYGNFSATTGTSSGAITGWNLNVYAYETTRSFPISFIDTNYSLVGISRSVNPYTYSLGMFNLSNESSYNFRAVASQANYARNFAWIAIGRWK